jgi:hypothetical protein
MKTWRLLAAAVVLAGALVVPQTVRAESYGENAGWGALAVLANLGYMPTKLVYATFGGLTGGLAYLVTLGDYQTSEQIWVASLGGTYVLTPSMMRGQEPIVFAAMPEPTIPVASGVAETPPPPAAFEDRPLGKY